MAMTTSLVARALTCSRVASTRTVRGTPSDYAKLGCGRYVSTLASKTDRDGETVPKFDGGDAEGDTNPMQDIENVTGSDHGDLLVGDEDSNLI